MENIESLIDVKKIRTLATKYLQFIYEISTSYLRSLYGIFDLWSVYESLWHLHHLPEFPGFTDDGRWLLFLVSGASVSWFVSCMRPSCLFTPRGRPASSVASRRSLCLLLFRLAHDYTGETRQRHSLMRPSHGTVGLGKQRQMKFFFNFVELDLELFSLG